MASANSNIQVTDLDFVNIKQNFINFLKSQDTFKDYNFSGSGLSVLLDVLAYNTQYNAYYLNMVANEMFMDTALMRSSVVSHAKLLNYVPKSAIAPEAIVNVVYTGVTDKTSLTLPKYSNFYSEAIKGVNYNFVNTDSYTVSVVNNTATFNNVILKQGTPVTKTVIYSQSANPQAIFELPEQNIDTSTIKVEVYPNPSNSAFDIYNPSTQFLTLSDTSKVYFLQESVSGTYQIYFGDGVLGARLIDGCKVVISYLTTKGTAAAGANNYVIKTNLGQYTNVVNPITPANGGADKESIKSIKYNAPKAYAAQNRAVTNEDYITLLQQNNLGYAFDAVNVWGGETLNPPKFGKVFIAIKPAGGYSLTNTQKNEIITKLVKPISVMTVTPEIVDPDYVYVTLKGHVVFDTNKTNYTTNQIEDIVKNTVKSYSNSVLNSFNSTFSTSDLLSEIKLSDSSIIAVDSDLYLQKKLKPALGSINSYTLNFSGKIERGYGDEQFTVTPSFSQYDDNGNLVPQVYMEESKEITTYIQSITLTNGGSGYTNPTVKIYGDGNGATAHAVVVNGIITSIVVDSGGNGYSQANIVIVDSTGTGASAIPNIITNVGTLSTYYFDTNGIKNTLVADAGKIYYDEGLIKVYNFAPVSINNTEGVLYFTAYSESRIVETKNDRILTLDSGDPNSISFTVIAK